MMIPLDPPLVASPAVGVPVVAPAVAGTLKLYKQAPVHTEGVPPAERLMNIQSLLVTVL
jgi:hypothetical protein